MQQQQKNAEMNDMVKLMVNRSAEYIPFMYMQNSLVVDYEEHAKQMEE